MHRTDFKLLLISFFIWVVAAGNGFAAESIEIVRADGNVVVKQAGQKDRSVGSVSILPSTHTLVTGPNGRAVIRIGDSGYIIVEKNSTIEVSRKNDHADFFRQITGMIYYAMNALRRAQPPIEVKMSAATLGIRGTRFLVTDLPDRKEVGMRKGMISVTSLDKDFEIHRKAEQDEFEAFKQEGKDAIAKEKLEFEEYKAKSQREFIEYKREFSLGANRMATFDGKRVEDRPLSEESKKDMETLEDYGKKWIAEVRD